MNCPKCNDDFERVAYRGIEIDRCVGCRGIWFDMLEREQLSRLEGSEQIDVGAARIGERYNRIDRIDCPSCGTRMIRMVDAEQPHVWYEACKSCNGVFLDAGEFTDLKERTLLDRFRALFAPSRS